MTLKPRALAAAQLLLVHATLLAVSTPALANGQDSAAAMPDTAGSVPAQPLEKGERVGTYVLPPPAPDPRAYRDTTLTYEEQSRLDEKLRLERRTAHIDSLHLNEHVVLALHAAPSSAHRTPTEIERLARDCDSLVTAVPPGDWDIFLIVGSFDLLNGAAFCFDWPDDWILRGFTLSPTLRTPFAMGDLNKGATTPYMVAFDCLAHPEKEGVVPAGLVYTAAEVAVIGRLEITATSPGSLTIEDHPAYGSTEVANCWGMTQDIIAAARGRIDVGSGPGERPCQAGKLLSPGGAP